MTILILTLASGCSSAEDDHYDAGYNGREVTVEKGKNFSVGMVVNIQTGMQWQIVEFDSNIVELTMPPRAMPQIAIGGLPRLDFYNFMFLAKNTGTTTLKMKLVKAGEENPVDTFSMTIVVK